jgi:hypothetical protein
VNDSLPVVGLWIGLTAVTIGTESALYVKWLEFAGLPTAVVTNGDILHSSQCLICGGRAGKACASAKSQGCFQGQEIGLRGERRPQQGIGQITEMKKTKSGRHSRLVDQTPNRIGQQGQLLPNPNSDARR